jgi:hypothetical protein
MQMLIALMTDVTEDRTVKGSVETLVRGIADQVKTAGTDPAKVTDLSNELKGNAPAIAKAVLANTPATSPAAVAAAWKPQTAYVAGAYVQPVPPNGHTYVATVAGTSGQNQPVFPLTVGASVPDGSVTWAEKTATPA